MGKPKSPRRTPTQARSRQTVAWILEGAARVFRRRGLDATTNEIAREAGVSIGSVYEYFSDKQALLRALGEAHVDTAEQGIRRALEQDQLEPLLHGIRAAVVASHRFPSPALACADDGVLARRVLVLRQEVLQRLAAHSDRPAGEAVARARGAFGAVAELPSLVAHREGARASEDLAHVHVGMAMAALNGPEPAPEQGS